MNILICLILFNVMGKWELTVVHVLHIPIFRTIFGSPRDIQLSLPSGCSCGHAHLPTYLFPPLASRKSLLIYCVRITYDHDFDANGSGSARWY
jgi:hypothetical protein